MARRVSDSDSEEIGIAGPSALLAAHRRPSSRKRSRPSQVEEVEEIDSDSDGGGDADDFAGLTRRRRPRPVARRAPGTQSSKAPAAPPARAMPAASRAPVTGNGHIEGVHRSPADQCLWIDEFAPEKREDLAVHRTVVTKVGLRAPAG